MSKGAKLDRLYRPSFISKDGHTPLHLAIYFTFPDVARALIRGGTSNLEDRGSGFSKIDNIDARGGQAEWQQVIRGKRVDHILWGAGCERMAIGSVDFGSPNTLDT